MTKNAAVSQVSQSDYPQREPSSDLALSLVLCQTQYLLVSALLPETARSWSISNILVCR